MFLANYLWSASLNAGLAPKAHQAIGSRSFQFPEPVACRSPVSEDTSRFAWISLAIKIPRSTVEM
jgi:hypothetical protein